jgi:hypothetical protein
MAEQRFRKPQVTRSIRVAGFKFRYFSGVLFFIGVIWVPSSILFTAYIKLKSFILASLTQLQSFFYVNVGFTILAGKDRFSIV